MRQVLTGLTGLLLVLTTTTCPAEDWAQFRGNNATGVSTGSKNLPVEFSHKENVLWSAEIGEGVACPIVSAGKVVATTMVDEQTFAVLCFDAVTGKELWRQELETGPTPEITSPNTQASSTPAADGERVIPGHAPGVELEECTFPDPVEPCITNTVPPIPAIITTIDTTAISPLSLVKLIAFISPASS